MAAGGQLTNVFDSADLVGAREDLSDLIDDISPTDTPFTSSIGSSPAGNVQFDWQENELAAAAQNHQVQGFDVTTYTAANATARIYNHTSISSKDFVVSGTVDAMRKAGRGEETAYQATLSMKELKRDRETNFLANNATVAPNGATAGETGGLAAFIKTNENRTSTNGAAPDWTSGPTDARSDGELRAFTEAMLRDCVLQVWETGGEPTLALLPGYQKQVASGFAGNAAQRYQAPTDGSRLTTIMNGAEIYMHDFGTLALIPSRFQRGREVFVVDPDGAQRRVLRPSFMKEGASSSDYEARIFICEEGLECQEKRHGIVADLTTS